MSGLDDLLGGIFGGRPDPLKDISERAQREKNRKDAAQTVVRGTVIDGIPYLRAEDVARCLFHEGLHDSVTLRRVRAYLKKKRDA